MESPEADMHRSTPFAASCPTETPGRPLWMLAALAFGIGPLLVGLLLDSQLAAANTWLANAWDLDRAQIHSMRLVLRVLLPTCLVLGLLRFTALGRWIVITPVMLTLLLVADAFLLLHLLNQILRLVLVRDGFLVELLGAVGSGIALTALCTALLLLAMATAWYRSNGCQRWLTRASRRWFREI